MFPIDIRTAAFFCFLVAAVATSGMGALWLRDRRGYLADWASGHLCLALGFLFISLRGRAPDALSIVAGNGLVLLGLISFHQGICRFAAAPVWHLAGAVLLLVSLTVHAGFTYLSPDTTARVIWGSLLLSGPCLAAAVRLFRRIDRDNFLPYAVAAGPLLGLAVFLWVRAAHSARTPVPEDFMSAGQMHGLTFLVGTLMITATLIGFSGLHVQRLLQELEQLARTDQLTGLSNRRSLEEAAEREVSRARRAGAPLCVLMIDVDRFKQINDSRGHQEGDRVLRLLGGIIRRTLRPYDVAGRYGGEEFCVLLPHTDAALAGQVAERIRALARAELEGPQGPVTVSIGVSALAAGETHWAVANRRADEALYEAKRAGRDRVVVRGANATA
jgi:diguanylate cyclase (GGDEF)-like protein